MTDTSATKKASIERKTKILRITIALTALSFIIFLITLTSSHWIIISYPSEFLSARQNMYVSRSRYGIIWECIIGRSKLNSTYETRCDFHQNQVQNASLPAEQTLVGMIRTMLSFSIIYMLLAIIALICGLYSIRDYRYTYKRLTAMIYILTAASLIVCIEVLTTIYRHSNQHLHYIYPPGTKYSYGACFIFAWIIFIQLLVSSCIFFVCSRKRKGTFDEATEEEALANQPVNLGR
ncbi:unnamed protein product [Rotaria magnacalcarata]|uniref:Uncharacterized protein n=3 Tax=Rotaria magnacalcarata TaxID=392030 RepID=A0A816XLV7_9BILA|nr:unnamed protein product [Rotaria magnacalcarata]CAF1623921.1 unnamed protein product [Rotaria magnacalcarata]CAF1962136.1 unnamed protein product [Rotaria magnacalcarata]CAF2134396.1 unnamed protein product [Rotaria magnacalcarata]CAF2147479.1 unnamed protein product [Rotaria magnacalcarata]